MMAKPFVTFLQKPCSIYEPKINYDQTGLIRLTTVLLTILYYDIMKANFMLIWESLELRNVWFNLFPGSKQ